MMRIERTPLTRRRLLRLTTWLVVGGTGSLLAACAAGGPIAGPTEPPRPIVPAATPPGSPAPAVSPVTVASPAASPSAAPSVPAGPLARRGGTLRVLQWRHFVPAYDRWLDEWAGSWGQQARVEVRLDHVDADLLPARLAAEAAAGVGHDVIQFQGVVQTWTYANKLVDLDDLVDLLGKKYGGWIDLAAAAGKVKDTWKGLPDAYVASPIIWRKDLFDGAGLPPPDSYDGLLEAGRKLKARGNPSGWALSHCNDANRNWRAILLAFGGRETDKDGRVVTLNSKETVEALKYARELFDASMTDEVFAWDNAADGRAYASGRTAYVHDTLGSYFTTRDTNPDVFRATRVGLEPRGRDGKRYNVVDASVYAIWSFSNEKDTARAFLVALQDAHAEAARASNGVNLPFLNDLYRKPMVGLDQDPNLAPLMDWKDLAYLYGWPGPPTPAAEEALFTFVIPDMFTRVARGDKPEDAAAWADAEYKRIYAKFRF